MQSKLKFKQDDVLILLHNKIEDFRNITGEKPSFIIVDRVYYNRICFNSPLLDSLTKNYQLKKEYQGITIVLIPGIEQPYLEVIGDAEHTYMYHKN